MLCFTRLNGREDLNKEQNSDRSEASNIAELLEKAREIIGFDANFIIRMLI